MRWVGGVVGNYNTSFWAVNTSNTANQQDATPFYRALAAATGDQPGWNFHKYLIGRDGTVVASFGSRTKPEAPEMVQAIEKAIAAPKP